MSRFIGKCAAIITSATLILCSAATIAQAEQAQTAPSFTEEEQSYIANADKLKVGFIQDRIPICFADQNGEVAGISRYIFERVSEISGLEFEYVGLPSGPVTYDYLLSEGFDLVTSVEYNEENKHANGILISEPYFSGRKVIVAKDDLEFRYGDNLSAAVSTGSQTLKKVLARMFPNFELKDYDSIEECFDAVNSGDADLMIQNQYVVEYWLSKPKYEQLKVIPMIGLDDKLCFSAVVALGDKTDAVSKEGQTLIDILDKSIACLTEDEVGSYTIQGVMENQYKYTFSDFVSRYRYSFIVMGIAVVIILALIILFTRQRIRFAESKAESKAKGRFLSTMSHEIRTPLNGLIGLNYLMSQKLDDRKKVEEYLRQSSATAKYLLSLLNDILDSSKLEEQEMELVLRPVDLELLIDTVNSIEKNLMADKRLTYTVHSGLTYPYVMADEVRVQQVLLNLLDNARKFTQTGGKIDLIINQEKTSNDKVLTSLVVSDTGKGMSEDFQKKVFNVFSRELDTVSKGNQGTGLGLFISRRLARLMGGDLTCVSKKGEGSSFTFTFVSDISKPPEKTDVYSADINFERPRILIAEDNELNGEIILELLTGNGFEADLAENGKLALDMFENSEPDTYGVILMDLLMPEMDGFEAAKAIRSLDRPDAKTVRILACTANSFSEERDRAIASGMDDFISKPIDIDVLMKKLK